MAHLSDDEIAQIQFFFDIKDQVEQKGDEMDPLIRLLAWKIGEIAYKLPPPLSVPDFENPNNKPLQGKPRPKSHSYMIPKPVSTPRDPGPPPANWGVQERCLLATLNFL